MDKLPFTEHREVIAEREVVVPYSIIKNWDMTGCDEKFKKTPLFDDDDAKGVISVIHDVLQEINRNWYSIAVEVEGMQENADVLIRGHIKWQARNHYGKASTTDLWAGESISWTRGNGRLASLVRCHTYEVVATVTVFGPRDPPSPSMAPLRSLAELSDVTLDAAGRHFAVHRLVLAARSPVLHAMFTVDFKESTDKVVKVSVDCSGDVFDAFVNFLYSGSGALGERDCADLIDLLELGERYMVAELKAECVRRLLDVRVEDALAVFQAALEKPFVPSEVRLKAAEVLRKNWTTVVASNDWRSYAANQPAAALMMESLLSGLGSEAAPTQ